jgi:hypothetical protein
MVSIHVDVDNLWNYVQEFGAGYSGNYDLIYTTAVPLMVEMFSRYGVRATFFICAKELSRPSCVEICREAIRRGHEIANHTLNHPTTLYRLTKAEKHREVVYSGRLIEDRLGTKVYGFRAPGYYIDDDIVDLLTENAYLYDTSVLPSFMNLLMGTYIGLKTGRKIDKAFGRKRYAVASRAITKIFSRTDRNKFIYELPITTLPLLRLPIHSTMLYLLGERYVSAVQTYLRSASGTCIYVFHAVDALDYTADAVLCKNVPALQLALSRRVQLIEQILQSCQGREFVTAKDLVTPELTANVPASNVFSWRMSAGGS